MRFAVALAIALLGCGDNLSPPGPPLVTAHDLAIVAHQDDDLLFMQHDLFDRVEMHTGLTIVYVTAGDGGNGLAFSEQRDAALRAAYGLVASATDWQCGWIDIASHPAEHCRLPDANLSLVFLDYPDGGVGDTTPDSLLHLWEGVVPYATTIAERTTTYSQRELIDTVASIISTTDPSVLRTLDIAGTHEVDHYDHLFVGSLAMLAALQTGSEAQLISYRGYNINYEAATVPDAIYERDSTTMRAYEGCMLGCGTCGIEPCPTLSDPRYEGFLHRRYAIAQRETPLSGILATSSGCITVGDNDQLSIGECASAATIEFRDGGRVAIGGRCLQVERDNSIVLGSCELAPNRAFLFDDEGHIWSGVPPAPQAGMDAMHTLCIVDDTDQLRVALCGAYRDVKWSLLGRRVVTPHPSEAATMSGRAIRLGDLDGDGKADMCQAGSDGLYCGDGDGAGGFSHLELVVGPAFSIVPESLVLGDVDGDGMTDACGRDAGGILCALQGQGFAVVRWTTEFAATGPATARDRSLAISNGQVCGATRDGVTCVSRTERTVLTTWPTAEASVWPGDLDGDGQPDWCASTLDGFACAVAKQRKLSEDGVMWSYSLQGSADDSVSAGNIADPAHAAIGDITGDGRDDMCVAIGTNVECVVSQAYGFGPQRLALRLPPEKTIAGLWLGDLDGDGRADPCVDDGTNITCALSP
jgi:hypothetical protein